MVPGNDSARRRKSAGVVIALQSIRSGSSTRSLTRPFTHAHVVHLRVGPGGYHAAHLIVLEVDPRIVVAGIAGLEFARLDQLQIQRPSRGFRVVVRTVAPLEKAEPFHDRQFLGRESVVPSSNQQRDPALAPPNTMPRSQASRSTTSIPCACQIAC